MALQLLQKSAKSDTAATPLHKLQGWAQMTEISLFALINKFFLRGATEQNTR